MLSAGCSGQDRAFLCPSSISWAGGYTRGYELLTSAKGKEAASFLGLHSRSFFIKSLFQRNIRLPTPAKVCNSVEIYLGHFKSKEVSFASL